MLLPLCTMGFSLAIVDAVSPSVSVGGLLRLSRKCTTWILGLLMTVFLGVLSMQNWLGSSVDTAASKTTKYVIANFVPVVGSAVSDAYTTVRSSLQMLRSTTGVVGMVSLCVLFLPPLVQLLLYRGVVAIGAAAAELFGTRSLLRLLRGTQQALAIAFALLVCFGGMFVVSTAIAAAARHCRCTGRSGDVYLRGQLHRARTSHSVLHGSCCRRTAADRLSGKRGEDTCGNSFLNSCGRN